MKIDEPNWVGKQLRCFKCDTRFTLEVEDEDKVRFERAVSIDELEQHNLDIYQDAKFYFVYCPKCEQELHFIATPKKSTEEG